MGVDESILVVLSLLVHTYILGAVAVCLIQSGLYLTYLLPMTNYGYISIIGDVEKDAL